MTQTQKRVREHIGYVREMLRKLNTLYVALLLGGVASAMGLFVLLTFSLLLAPLTNFLMTMIVTYLGVILGTSLGAIAGLVIGVGVTVAAWVKKEDEGEEEEEDEEVRTGGENDNVSFTMSDSSPPTA